MMRNTNRTRGRFSFLNVEITDGRYKFLSRQIFIGDSKNVSVVNPFGWKSAALSCRQFLDSFDEFE